MRSRMDCFITHQGRFETCLINPYGAIVDIALWASCIWVSICEHAFDQPDYGGWKEGKFASVQGRAIAIVIHTTCVVCNKQEGGGRMENCVLCPSGRNS